MSRKSGRPYNLILAILVLIGLGGVLGVSSLSVRVSVIGSLIVIVAVLESAIILGGITLLNRRQPRRTPTSDST